MPDIGFIGPISAPRSMEALMQTENRLFDDLARVASGAINTLGGLREEIELRVKERLERLASEMDLVSREEFDAVKAMAAKARAEQNALEKRILALEAALAAAGGEKSGTAAKSTDAKPARRAVSSGRKKASGKTAAGEPMAPASDADAGKPADS
jgi:BMFP domain-containing protein YqiC